MKSAVVVESFALCFNAMAALPGPYVNAFLHKIGVEGLFKVLSSFEDKSAVAEYRVAFSAGPGSLPKVCFEFLDRHFRCNTEKNRKCCFVALVGYSYIITIYTRSSNANQAIFCFVSCFLLVFNCCFLTHTFWVFAVDVVHVIVATKLLSPPKKHHVSCCSRMGIAWFRF